MNFDFYPFILRLSYIMLRIITFLMIFGSIICTNNDEIIEVSDYFLEKHIRVIFNLFRYLNIDFIHRLDIIKIILTDQTTVPLEFVFE